MLIDAIFCPKCGTKQPDTGDSGKVSQNFDKEPVVNTGDVRNVNSINNVSETDSSKTTVQDSFVDNYQNDDHESHTDKSNDPLVNNRDNTNYGTMDSLDRIQDTRNTPNEYNNGAFYSQGMQTPNNIGYDQSWNNASFRQETRGNYSSWHPYNESGNPGLTSSFEIWLHAINNVNKCMGRADFWWGYLAIYILNILVWICAYFVEMIFWGTDGQLIAILLVTVSSIAMGIMSFIAVMERLHDTGHSGWNYWWTLTGIGGLYVLYLLCQPTNWRDQRWVRMNGR